MTFEELFPPEVLEKLPALYATEGQADAVVTVKLFYPCFHYTWFLMEYDPQEKLAFALVDGDFCELGLVSIEELLTTRDKLGNEIERDLYFTPISLRLLQAQLRFIRAGQ